MVDYNKIIGRPSDDKGSVVPPQIVNDVIKLATASSSLLSRAKTVRMSSKTYTQPVMASIPSAEFVNGVATAADKGGEPGQGTNVTKPEEGLKSTSNVQWEPLTMTAEEIACIVPIPDALVDDSAIPLWNEVRPLLAEAVGRRLDEAAIFGKGLRPKSWDPALVTGAQTVDASAFSDFGAAIADAGSKLAKDGVSLNGFISGPGIQWALAGARDALGRPIYTPGVGDGAPGSLYGFPLNETMNGSWNSADADLRLIAADWSKVIVGIRQDVTFETFREGVITDASGAVVLNLMQQDAKALRVVFRVGYAVAKPFSAVKNAKINPVVTISKDPVEKAVGGGGDAGSGAKSPR